MRFRDVDNVHDVFLCDFMLHVTHLCMIKHFHVEHNKMSICFVETLSTHPSKVQTF